MPRKDSKKTTSTETDESIDFEKIVAQLEELVGRMESGELGLEESLKTFETGIKLTRECQNALSKAEQKVQILLAESGKEQLADFQEIE